MRPDPLSSEPDDLRPGNPFSVVSFGPNPTNGHDWQWIYHGKDLVGMRCLICERTPAEVLSKDGELADCQGAISAMLKGFNL